MLRRITYGVLCIATVAMAGVVERIDMEARNTAPKAPIVKDYVCLRDGELCHPEFAKNRGLFITCANGIAWEQTCGKCAYNPITCPTKSLWFNGEKCDWASPKLASQPCMDRFPFPLSDLNNATDGVKLLSDQEMLQMSQTMSQAAAANPEKNKYIANQVPAAGAAPGSGFYKAPKATSDNSADSQGREVMTLNAVKAAENFQGNQAESDSRIEPESSVGFPSYLSPEDSGVGSKIIRLNEPVYALVNSPDNPEKQVLMRVHQPFALEDPARSLIPNVNFINPYAFHKD